LAEAIGLPVQPSSDRNNVPVTGFCTRRGNLNASREIVCREKKFTTFAPKTVHIGTFIGQFRTLLDILAQFFRWERAFWIKSEHWK
jgi:hypothetical protein